MKHNNYMKSVGIVSILVIMYFSTAMVIEANALAFPLNPSKIYGPDTVLIPWLEYCGNGSDSEMDIGPTGTISVIYTAPWEEGHKVMYVDNATGSWSDPIVLLTPTFVNNNNKDMVVDDNGDVHIICDTGSATGLTYISNKSGTWQSKSFNSIGVNTASIAVDSTGDHVYTASYGTHNGQVYYCNASYTGTTISNFQVRTFDFHSIDSANVTSFTDIAVSSSGYVYIVFRGFKEICYEKITPTDNYIGPTVISDSGSESMSYSNWPEINIDDNDVVHVTYQRNVYANKDLSGLYYIQLNSTTTPSDAYKISTAINPGGQAHLTVDNNNNPVIGYGFSNFKQLTNYDSQIAYLSNQTGSWQNFQITNVSTSKSTRFWAMDIEVNPVTNDSVILVENGDQIEVMTMRNGYWGTQLEYTAEISELVVPYQGNSIKVNITIENLGPTTRNFNTVMKIAQPYTGPAARFENAEGNSQPVDEMIVNQQNDYEWQINYTGGGNYYIEVGMVINESIEDKMYFSVLWMVTITVDIPAADTLLVLGMIFIGSLYLFIHTKRKISK
jgi:hypothetical protein